MTNEELNRAMAELCGIEIIHDGPHIIAAITSYWNPVGDWNQVVDHVMPALEGMGFDYKIAREAPDAVEVEVCEQRSSGNPIYATSLSGADAPLSRRFCEAAWGAWQQLEKT